MVKEGSFREDLYYRLNVIPLTIPPLRKRKGDITLLANHFCEKYGLQGGLRKEMAPETIRALSEHDWRGNARELENVVQRATTLSTNSTIYPQDLFLPKSPGLSKCPTSSGSGPESVAGIAPQDDEAVARLQLKAGFSMSEMEEKLIHLTLTET